MALLPAWLLRDVVVRLMARRARRLPADEALRFLFHIDNALYAEEGRQAVRYGRGVHTKHKHTGYHDFFVGRVGPSERVLDIGCGIGALAYDVARRSGAQVVGIDCNQQNLEQAHRQFRHPGVAYRHGDVLRALPAEPFDVVILSNVLEHFPDRTGFLKRLRESTGAKRLLIRVPLFQRDWRVPLKKELDVEWRLDDDHQTEYTPEGFCDEMRSAGLAVQHLEARWGEIWAVVGPDPAMEKPAHAA